MTIIDDLPCLIVRYDLLLHHIIYSFTFFSHQYTSPLLFTFLLLSVGSAAAKQSLRQLGAGGGNHNGWGDHKHSHRCKDNIKADGSDPQFPDACGLPGGKHNEDTCQPCCACDCHDSADTYVPPTASGTCDVLVNCDGDYDKKTSTFTVTSCDDLSTCADAGNVDPDSVTGACAGDEVDAACDALCHPSNPPSNSPAPNAA